jgi:uncharacterized protein
VSRDALAGRFSFPRHERLWRLVEPLMAERDLAHERLHVLRVHAWAVRLAPEAGADRDLAGAAALVHDLADVPKESAARAEGGTRSAEVAGTLLAQAGYSPTEADEIVAAVRTSSWSKGLDPAGPAGLALQEADRLDAIGAIGVLRTALTAQAMACRGAKLLLYEPADPLARDRAADDRKWGLDHFPVKLLRLAERMRLPSAVAEARRRHETMRTFLAALQSELGAGRP